MVHVLKEIVALPPTLDESALGVIRPAFYVMAGAIAVAVLVLRSRWLTVEAAPPSLATLQTRLITCLALAEAIGVFGLVLFMMGGMLRDFYVLWVPAIGLQLLLTPTREVWEAAAHGGRPRPR
jgi:hypothetical protein